MRFLLEYIANGHTRRFKADFDKAIEENERKGKECRFFVGNSDIMAEVDCLFNGSNDLDSLSVVLHSRVRIILKQAVIEMPYRYDKDCDILLNGYQSWTETREYKPHEKVHSLDHLPSFIKNKYHFPQYGDSYFFKYDKDIKHSFTWSYIKHRTGESDLIGSLNDHIAFLIICHDIANNMLRLMSDCAGRELHGDIKLFDLIMSRGPALTCQRNYFERFGKSSAPVLYGYTSWYRHYQDINEKTIYNDLAGINTADGYDLFQIDDGYETFVGDWLSVDAAKFPHGIAPIADEIHSKGLKAGIWLAPFVAETKSRLCREHPKWILKKDGKDVYAGCNWSGDVALDIRRADVWEYIEKCLCYYKDMGFDLFKLDFLYAAALCSDSMHTRAEIMRESMQRLRDILGDRLIIGCGVPLASAFNLVDYCRIGPDISLSFDDIFYMRFMHRERISTKTTIQNTIFRTVMDGTVFRCDPDVYLLGDKGNRLTADQRSALVQINHMFGSICLTGDDIALYDEEKKKLHDMARTLADAEVLDINSRGRDIEIRYAMDGREYLMVYDRQSGILRKDDISKM